MAGKLLPVILNENLQHHDITRLLHQQQYKVRVSESTLKNTIIFPRSGIAFMVVSLQDATEDRELLQRIKKMLEVHRTCYILCLAPIYDEQEKNLFAYIQQRFLRTKVNLVPVHNSSQCISMMKTLANVLDKSNIEAVCCDLTSRLEYISSNECLSQALASAGLEPSVCGYLLDNLSCLRSVASSDRNQLLEASCYDTNAVSQLEGFFHGKTSE